VEVLVLRLALAALAAPDNVQGVPLDLNVLQALVLADLNVLQALVLVLAALADLNVPQALVLAALDKGAPALLTLWAWEVQVTAFHPPH
jgi:hypothetical protein